MSGPALQLRDVSKRFGATQALRSLSFSIPRGAISGLVGPNGAGKTTCFGVVGGLLKPNAGQVDVLGQGAYQPARQSGMLGLLPQDSEVPAHTRVETFLRYLARLQGASSAQAARQAERVLDQVALSDRRGARIGTLSHGMRRRVAVAQALLGSPQLVLLDEPTSGLDPHLVAQMRDLLRQERKRGATLLVSSHMLGELEAVCDHVVFMQAGRATRSGPMADVTGRGRFVTFSLERPPELETLTARLTGVDARYEEPNLLRVVVSGSEPLGVTNDRVLRALIDLDAGVREVRAGDSLERAYLDTPKGDS